MSLCLIERPDGFGDSDGYNPHWWAPRLYPDHSTYLAVVDKDGIEVARIEMLYKTHPGYYVGMVESPDFIKVHTIEVHASHRRRGIARIALRLLAEHYPNRRLLAFSEADEFWESLGWSRHIHRDDDPATPRHQVLFLQPPETSDKRAGTVDSEHFHCGRRRAYQFLSLS